MSGAKRSAEAGFVICMMLALVWVGGCESKKSPAADTEARSSGTAARTKRDARPDPPLPPNTAGVGFALPKGITPAGPSDSARGITVVDRGKGKPIDVALSFDTGGKQSIEYVMTLRLGDVEARSTMAYDLVVESVTGEGAQRTATLRLTYEKITMRVSPDSQRARAMAALAAKASGQSLTATITTTGDVKVVKIDSVLAEVLRTLQVDQAQLLVNLYPRFPAGSLGAGAKWLTQLKTTNNQATSSVDITYTLSSATPSPAGLRVTLDVVGNIGLAGPQVTGGGGMRGQIVLIPSHGKVLKSSLRQDVRLRAQGQAANMSLLVDAIDKSAE